MNYLTNDKLVIIGAAGMIGSNMAQTAIMMVLLLTSVFMTPMSRVLKALPRSCGSAVSRVST